MRRWSMLTMRTRSALALVSCLLLAAGAGAATRISGATGNWTAAGTWKVADSTSLLDSEVGSTSLTTSYLASAGSVPGAIEIDAVCVKGVARATSPGASTVSVKLYNSTDSVDAFGPVTIDTADVSLSVTGGWICFAGSPVTLLAGKTYNVQAKASATLQLSLYRDATANNHARLLRTTTTGAPAAGDNMAVVGHCTASATCTTYTVTMDSTAATDYGTAVTAAYPAALSVSQYGVLNWGTAASTTYILQMSGNLVVNAGGVYQQGTTGTRMPSTSTATLQFDCAADGDFGVWVRAGGNFEAHGAVKKTWSLLTADIAAAGTVLTVADTTGWAATDVLVLAPTRRTYSEYEEKTISTVDSGTQVTLTAGATYAHDGTGMVVGSAGNLNKNVVIKGVTSTLMTYIYTLGTLVDVDVSHTLLRYSGSAITNKRGVNTTHTSGTVVFDDCLFRNADAALVYAIGTITVTDSFFYEVGTSAAVTLFGAVAHVISGNMFTNIGTASASTALTLASNAVSYAATIANNRISGGNDTGGTAVYMASAEAGNFTGTFTGNVIHSNRGVGMSARVRGTIGDAATIIARNATGISLSDSPGVVVAGGYVVGNTNQNVLINDLSEATFKNMVIAGETSYATPSGISFTSTASIAGGWVLIEDSTFGSGSGLVTHTTADINAGASALYSYGHVTVRNSLLASATEVGGVGNFYGDAFVSCQRCDQTDGVHWTETANVRVARDTNFSSDGDGVSARLTPRSASAKGEVLVGHINVNDGKAGTIRVAVRESVAGDGTDYNGARARLVVKRSTEAGIASDTVLATASAASEGGWEVLRGTTPVVTDFAQLQVVVDVDGTTGWVNVDNAVAYASTAGGKKQHWYNGLPSSCIPRTSIFQ